MRTFVTAALFLSSGWLRPSSLSFSALAEDLEGSGSELEGSGSGSGDGSDHGSNRKVLSSDVINIVAKTPWPPVDFDADSDFVVIVGNSQNFLDNKNVISSIIAGVVTGVLLAALLAAVLTYKWQKKDNEGYIPGQQVHRDERISL